MQNIQRANTNVNKFIELFLKGIELWLEAGRIVSQALEEDPDFAEKVNAAHPEISVDTVYAFDRIGRKQLHPKLVISDSPGARKLRRLPYTMQEKYTDEPVPVLIRTESGWETLKVNVFNLTSEQAAQVFDGDVIRTEGAQRAWLESKASKALIQVDEPYRVSGRKLLIMQPCQLNAKQLATILAQME